MLFAGLPNSVCDAAEGPAAVEQAINAKEEAMQVADKLDRFSFVDTQVLPFHSTNVGVDYKLYISLPRNYRKDEKRTYPLLIVLDADYSFPMVHTIARFMQDHDTMTDLVIVGLAYPGVSEEKYGAIFKTNRTRDYTPTNLKIGGYGKEIQKSSGGAEHFLDAIEKEIVPELKSKFRISANDIGLVGYSYSGLFCSYALVTRPELFQKFLIVSPSLWWDNRLIFRLEAKRAATQKDLKAKVYFAVGSTEDKAHGNQEMVGDLQRFSSSLKLRKYNSFRSKVWIAPEEDHHTVFPGATMRGLMWLYSNASAKQK